VDEEILKLARFIVANGGRCFLTGGAVIDIVRGRPVEDWDLEVYGLSYGDLTAILERGGYECGVVGRSFGVLKTRAGGYDIDVSIPRLENRTGAGHRGFAVELAPGLDIREAARRRDLTINAMYYELPAGKLIDPFGGRADLDRGVLRAVDPKTFVEDPLRVLRIMQLLPRKGKTVDPGTVELCRSMFDEFRDLPGERVFDEWRKLLMKAETPSMGLAFLRDCGWIAHFPELESLIGCPQKAEWHPEGDVWTHTLRVVDAGASVRDRVPEEWRLPFMFGLLLHDTGKPATTDDDLTSRGHAGEGVEEAERFLRRMTRDRKLIDRATAIVREHMHPWLLVKSGAKQAAWRRLHNRLRLDVLGWVSRCDHAGRSGDGVDDPHEPSDAAFRYARDFGEEPIEPILMGRHLIERGFSPGPDFGAILKAAYDFQIETGCTDPDALLEAGLKNRAGGRNGVDD